MDERGVTARVPVGLAAALAALAMAGCKDSGLPGRNTPLADQQAMEWSYPAYEAGGAHAVKLHGQEWMVAGAPIRIPEHLLVAVDGADAEVSALATDSEPFSRLYMSGPDGWTPYARVPVLTGESSEH